MAILECWKSVMATLEDAITHLTNGDWEAAHALVQSDSSTQACWAHVIVHLMEGDTGNAGYWYRRAGRTARGTSEIASEIEALTRALS